MAELNHQLGEWIHDALDRVEHTSTVDAFCHSFTAIQGLLTKVQPWLPEDYFATRFIYGLRPEYQVFVLRFNPVSVVAAHRLAMIWEESVGESDLGMEAVVGFQNPDLDFNSPTISELGNLIHDSMDNITHTTSVAACYHLFGTLQSFLAATKPWLPDSYFADRFVSCLQAEYQNFVLRFKPTTMKAAYRLASIYEESLYLHYFPDSRMQMDEVSTRKSVDDITQKVPRTDSVCGEVLVGDELLVPTITMDENWNHQGKESAMLYHKHKISAALEITSNPYRDIIYFPIGSNIMSANEVFPIGSPVTYVPFLRVRDVHDSEKSASTCPGPTLTYDTEMALHLIKEPKEHPPDVSTLVEGCVSSRSYILLLIEVGFHQLHQSVFALKAIPTISILLLRVLATGIHQPPSGLTFVRGRVLIDVWVLDFSQVTCRIKHMIFFLNMGSYWGYLCSFYGIDTGHYYELHNYLVQNVTVMKMMTDVHGERLLDSIMVIPQEPGHMAFQWQIDKWVKQQFLYSSLPDATYMKVSRVALDKGVQACNTKNNIKYKIFFCFLSGHIAWWNKQLGVMLDDLADASLTSSAVTFEVIGPFRFLWEPGKAFVYKVVWVMVVTVRSGNSMGYGCFCCICGHAWCNEQPSALGLWVNGVGTVLTVKRVALISVQVFSVRIGSTPGCSYVGANWLVTVTGSGGPFPKSYSVHIMSPQRLHVWIQKYMATNSTYAETRSCIWGPSIVILHEMLHLGNTEFTIRCPGVWAENCLLVVGDLFREPKPNYVTVHHMTNGPYTVKDASSFTKWLSTNTMFDDAARISFSESTVSVSNIAKEMEYSMLLNKILIYMVREDEYNCFALSLDAFYTRAVSTKSGLQGTCEFMLDVEQHLLQFQKVIEVWEYQLCASTFCTSTLLTVTAPTLCHNILPSSIVTTLWKIALDSWSTDYYSPVTTFGCLTMMLAISVGGWSFDPGIMRILPTLITGDRYYYS